MSITKYSLVGKDRKIRSKSEPHAGSKLGRKILGSPPIVMEGSAPYVVLGRRGAKGKYRLTGTSYAFDYRLLRSLFLAKHEGKQIIWREGNPTPIDFNDEKYDNAIEDTASGILNLTETDPPERLLRPPRMPWAIIIMAAVAALGIGLALGQYLKK